jgi:hypothetical protein
MMMRVRFLRAIFRTSVETERCGCLWTRVSMLSGGIGVAMLIQADFEKIGWAHLYHIDVGLLHSQRQQLLPFFS